MWSKDWINDGIQTQITTFDKRFIVLVYKYTTTYVKHVTTH